MGDFVSRQHSRVVRSHDRTVDGSTSHPNLVVASLDKMLHDNYLCLVESNKQQIKDRSKIQAEDLETKATPQRVWIRPTHSASVVHSRDRRIKMKKSIKYLTC